jgi:hypothetical protein
MTLSGNDLVTAPAIYALSAAMSGLICVCFAFMSTPARGAIDEGNGVPALTAVTA